MTLATLLLVLGPVGTSVRIEGDGWIKFLRAGRAVYAREATLIVRDGALCASNGYPVSPSVPLGNGLFDVMSDGTLRSSGVAVGEILVATFRSAPSANDDGFSTSTDRPRMARASDAGCTFVTSQATSVAQSKTATDTNPDFRVVLRETVEVTGKTFSLAEVADLTGASRDIATFELGMTPPIGVELVMESSRIVARLRAARLVAADWSPRPGSARVRIRQASQPVLASALAGAAIEAATRQAPGEWTCAEAPHALAAPRGQLELVAERVSQSGRTATVVVAVNVDGTRFNSRSVRLVRAKLANLPQRGANVTVRIVSAAVAVSVASMVVSVDESTGAVTVRTIETKVLLTGHVLADGTIEVRA